MKPKKSVSKKSKPRQKDKFRKILVTSALPYANGPIHLGHLVEYIQTDIWVRYLKMCGHQAYYFCADDTHGTPIMIAAKKANLAPEAMLENIHREHTRDFKLFQIEFDNYYTTNSPENRGFAEYIYKKSLEKKRIARRSVRQLYCEKDLMFLPDRFVRGICPVCGAADQYGDSCEVCSSTYAPSELVHPKCSVCGSPPVFKESEHLFFVLSECRKFLEKWIRTPGRVDDGIRKKMDDWLSGELRDWDISRDGPYFGFEIPGEINKYFYVWLDAPIGYMASSKNFFSRTKPELFDEFWKKGSKSELYHFIGKDIAYFHVLFWPALLESADFRVPDAVFIHGFLTVNGEKMSKSRGTLIRAESYLRHLDPGALRFYYASKLSGGLDDLDLSSTEFLSRYNADVVGNLTNIFSRLCGTIAEKLDHTLSDGLTDDGAKLEEFALARALETMSAFENRNFARAMREITALGDAINKFINDREPWKKIKENPESARSVLTDALTAGRILAALMKPVLPVFAAGVEELLAEKEPLSYLNLKSRFEAGHKIRPYRHLSSRIDPASFDAMFEEEKNPVMEKKDKNPGGEVSSPQSEGIISMEEFSRVQLRVGKIISASTIDGADRLLQIELDVGEEKRRNVIAGIWEAYAPEDLKDMNVVCVTNLAPRKMKFGVSEAMLLAAGSGASLTLFVSHRSAKPGDLLK